jgi:serine/threonine protein kinase/tetratricopeptide (TPR) repeat protein
MALGRAVSSTSVRFGGEFELDVRAYELRRSGQLLKLERIPTAVLLLLIEGRGELVSRDQIADRVWGKDVFLDTDNSINAAIRKIRQVLADDPEQPRFVQTLTGRGYRFIAPVEEASPPTASSTASSSQALDAQDLIGKKVSHYRVLQVLGGGGMGVVYQAEDLKLGRRVAIKFLPSELSTNSKAFERFEREARAASALDHPNICSVYQLGEYEGQPFIVMQLLEGQTLREWIEIAAGKPGPERWKQMFSLAVEIADGLEAAHQKGIIHSDIKPANIFITTKGHVKILDFGIAKYLGTDELHRAPMRETAGSGDAPATIDSLATRTGASVGTPSYLSPEQILGLKLDARTDLFSFGLVLYEMATGKRAFAGDTVTNIRNAVLALPPLPARQVCPDLPAKLEKIINKSLEKDRDSRYQSAHDIRADLIDLSLAQVETPKHPRRISTLALAGVVLLSMALVILQVSGVRRRFFDRASSSQSTPGFKARTSIAVLGFRNLSGKPDQDWISTALSEMLSSDLSAGQQLRVLPAEDVARMKLDLNLPAADNYGRDTLGRIRDYLGSDVVVLGSYLATGQEVGSKVRIDLQLQDTRRGETIGVIQNDGTQGGLAELVSEGGAALRQKLGVTNVSAGDLRQVANSLPANPEAVRLYSDGLLKLQNDDAMGARDALEKAVALDEKHALSHFALAQAWYVLGYDAKAEAEAKAALDLSGDLSREERLSIEGRFHEYSHDLPAAIEVYKTLRNFFPDDLEYALRLATSQIKADLNKDALQTISRMRKLPTTDTEDARIDLTEAKASESLGDFSSAQKLAALAGRKAQERGRRLLTVQAKELEAWSWDRLGNLNKAELEMRESQSLAQAVQNQYMIGLSTRMLGVINEDKGDYEAARTFHKSALAIFQKIGAKRQLARALEATGNIDYEQERLADAKRYYEDALRVDREIAAPPGSIGSDLGSIANVLDSSGDLIGATAMQQESLNKFREAGDKRGESDVLLNLGNVLVERGELTLAKQNYDRALSITREIGYKSGSAGILNSLVDVYMAQDRLEQARSAAEQAIAIRQEIQAQTDVARSQLQLARVVLEEGNAVEAEQLARAAGPTFERQKAAGDASVSSAIFAKALLAQSRINEAKAAAVKALSFAHQTVDRSSNFAASLAAAEVDIHSGKVAEAIRTLESVRAAAARQGYRDFQFQARLELGELMLRSGNTANGQAQLRQLQNDALDKGFVKIARKAEIALSRKS